MPENSHKRPLLLPEEDLAALDVNQARDLLAKFMAPNPRAGALTLFDQRYVFTRPETVVNIQKQLERTVGQSTKGILYLAGEKSAQEGLHFVESLTEGLDAKGMSAEAMKRMVDVMALLGWGRFEITRLDVEARRYRLTLLNSPIADVYGPSKKPVCHLLAGFLAGIGVDLLGQQLLCEEVSCKAQGRPRCEFRLQPMPFA